MKNMVLFGIVFLLLSCGKGADVPAQQKTNIDVNTETQYKNELDAIRKSIKGETKIKVKKDGKGYSWEITGKDVQEILKANDALKKRLND
jgi:hypothetical protein